MVINHLNSFLRHFGQNCQLKRMTPTERQAIEARLQAATKGPWHTTAHSPDKRFYLTTVLSEDSIGVGDIFDHSTGEGKGNADLISNAPTDLRRCLDEITRLEAEMIRPPPPRHNAIGEPLCPTCDGDRFLARIEMDVLRCQICEQIFEDQTTEGRDG